MNNYLSDPFELELEKAMDLHDASHPFIESLRKKVMNHPKSGFLRRSRVWKVAFALVLFICLMVFAAGPKNVLAAVSQWFDHYFPGIGYVEDSVNFRILNNPATVKEDGAEVTIRWAYVVEDQTVIAYPEETDTRSCHDWLIYSPETRQRILNISLGKLYLPDGLELEWDFNGGYQPIPANINNAIFIVYTHKAVSDCPEDASCRCIDEDQKMEIPLQFVTPPPGTALEIYSVQFTPVAPATESDSKISH